MTHLNGPDGPLSQEPSYSSKRPMHCHSSLARQKCRSNHRSERHRSPHERFPLSLAQLVVRKVMFAKLQWPEASPGLSCSRTLHCQDGDSFRNHAHASIKHWGPIWLERAIFGLRIYANLDDQHGCKFIMHGGPTCRTIGQISSLEEIWTLSMNLACGIGNIFIDAQDHKQCQCTTYSVAE